MTDRAKRTASGHTVPTPAKLWFGMLGGAAAWTVHLIGSSVTAEWGGFAGLDQWKLLGITSIAWTVLALSLLMGLAALAATMIAYRSWRRLNNGETSPHEGDGTQETARFMALGGIILSGLFLLIIVAQSLPIFYYLQESIQ